MYGRDEASAGQEWANDACPTCDKPFNTGDHVVVDDDNVVCHYDCYEGTKPPFEEGATI